jgi:hypothetical protein
MWITEQPSQAVFGGVSDVSMTGQTKQFHAVGTDLIP